jgi:thioredoxin reductase (NADPH)
MTQKPELYNLRPSIITVYSTDWCPDCRRAKKFFIEHQVQYIEVNIEEIPDGVPFVKNLNNGKRVVPTIIFPDGEILAEPSNSQLAEKLGLQIKVSNN